MGGLEVWRYGGIEVWLFTVITRSQMAWRRSNPAFLLKKLKFSKAGLPRPDGLTIVHVKQLVTCFTNIFWSKQ